ncbi:MAG: SDR family NAD(P)-dependent oxidoreductase [Microthrixaceae bacterium]
MRDALGEVQSVLVLGGGSDIGRSLVTRLARGRCRTVILAGRPEDEMDSVADAARSAGATTVETIHWESTDVASHEKVIGGVFDTYGDIDLVYRLRGSWATRRPSRRSDLRRTGLRHQLHRARLELPGGGGGCSSRATGRSC